MFSKEQRTLLAEKLDPDRVRTQQDAKGKVRTDERGQPIVYVEAWDVVEQANRIFGPGNWSRETVSVQPIHDPVPRPDDNGQIRNMVASYWVKVRITVFSEDGARSIVREGCGASTAYQKTVGDTVEKAIKSAESDATKRAFATFGNQFGLALYDKTHKNVGHEEPSGGARRAPLDVGFRDAESARESASRALTPTPEHPPQPLTSQRALAHLEPRPNGHGKPNGGLRY